MATPTRAQIINALNNSLTTFANSLAAYLLDTDPYLADNDKDAMAAVNEIAASDKRLELAVSEMIVDLDGIPQIGSVDPWLSEMNYLSFPYLLDVLIEFKRKEIVRYKPVPARLSMYPEVKKLFADILKTHEDHLARLEGLRKSKYKSNESAGSKPAEAPPASGEAEEAPAGAEAEA